LATGAGADAEAGAGGATCLIGASFLPSRPIPTGDGAGLGAGGAGKDAVAAGEPGAGLLDGVGLAYEGAESGTGASGFSNGPLSFFAGSSTFGGTAYCLTGAGTGASEGPGASYALSCGSTPRPSLSTF
jgi:hypothetical protein